MSSPQLYRSGIRWQERHARELPGMTSASERAYFKWHAQEILTGPGAIVDLGSWFGSTTAALAMGLERNPHAEARSTRIHAYDQFLWEPWMDGYETRLGAPSVGDSFIDEFELTVRPWRERVEVHAGDLCTEKWTGPPIELLLVDAMKNWELTANIVREFYPGMISGQGHLIHQDFAHCYTPWIHLTTYELRDSLIPAIDVPASETVAFRIAGPLAETAAQARVTRDDFDDGDVEDAFRYSLSITSADKHSGILAARGMLAVYDGDLERAQALLDSHRAHERLSEFHENALAEAIAQARREDA